MEEPELVNPSQVLIEVRAASLDPVDLKVSLTSSFTFQRRILFSFDTFFMACSAQVSQGYGRGLRELVLSLRVSANLIKFFHFPIIHNTLILFLPLDSPS